MKKTVVTKTAINRALTMLRRLKKKNIEEQIQYLTIHLIRYNGEKEEKDILKKVQKKQEEQIVLQKTLAYKNAQWFWSETKMETLLSYRRELENYRKMVCSQHDRDLDEPEIKLVLPDDLAVILKWFKLC